MNIVFSRYSRTKLKLGEVFSADEINRCIGIIRTNGIRTKGIGGIGSSSGSGHRCRSVLPNLALLSHNCVSNARCIQLENQVIDVRYK